MRTLMRISRSVNFRTGFLLALAWWLVGCAGPPTWAPSKDDVLAAFNAKPEPMPDLEPKPPVNLYIDTSMSMRGFAAYPGSKFTNVALNISHKLTTASYTMRSYQFASGFERLTGNIERSIVQLSTYSGAETHLTELLQRVSSHLRSGEISVVISDLVQSTQLLHQMDLVKEFADLLAARRPEMLLLAFRSGFSGTYYISMGTGGSYPLNLSEGGTRRGRPFYVLIFAPNRPALETFRKYVLAGLSPEASFEPTLPPIEVEAREFVSSRRAPIVWVRYMQAEPLATRASPDALIDRLAENDPPEAGGSTAEFRFRVKRRVPVLNSTGYSLTVERVDILPGKHPSHPAPVKVEQSEIVPGKPPETLFVLRLSQLPRPGADSWVVLRIRARAGKGNLAPPEWVDGWSTLNDQSPSSGDRTLYLSVIVEAMIRAITENVVFSDHFIAFGRGS